MGQGREQRTSVRAGVLCVVVALSPCAAYASMLAGASLSGELSVSNSGAAVYQLPLLAPPGVIKPSLSIQYSSQGGNGPLGMGWSLGGLSQLSRCPRQKTIDGVDDGIVQYNANDRLCLDGQRLILTSGSAYGADGAEYRTQMESDTQVIGRGSYSSGTAWFEVRTKSGEVLEYGRTTDSRQLLTPTGTTTAVPYAWALSKASDRFSNYYTVSYQQDSNLLYPLKVEYAGNDKAGTAPSRQINFDWSSSTVRPDPLPVYLGGGVSGTMRYRLTSITNNANPARYRLSYTLSGAGLSNLTRVQYCPDGGETNCLAVNSQYGYDKDPQTGKRMSDPTMVLAAFGANTGGWGDQNTHPRQLADVNGDGRLDIVGFANDGVYVAFGTETGFTAPVKKLSAFGVTAGGWSSNSVHPRMVVDINGDGLADIVGFSSSGVQVALSTGEGFAAPTQWIAGYGTANGWKTQDEFPRTLADVDGDGLLDIAATKPDGSIVVSINKRTYFDVATNYPPAAPEPPVIIAPVFGPSQSSSPRAFVDVNGDGKTDLVWWRNLMVGSFYPMVAINTGNGFSKFDMWTNNFPPNSPATGGDIFTMTDKTWESTRVSKRILHDIDGDGLVDLIGITTAAYKYSPCWFSCVNPGLNKDYRKHSADIYIALNENGRGFGPARKIRDGGAYVADVSYEYNSSEIIDNFQVDTFPGWSRAVVFEFLGQCASMRKINREEGLELGECLVSGFTGSNGGWTAAHERIITDVNGDGYLDVLGFSDSGVFFSEGLGDAENKVQTLISDLSQSAISYGSLVSSSLYQKGSGSSFPLVDIQAPVSVVKSITNPDGLGGTRKTLYRYGGLRSHFDYGSLGFQWLETMDEASGALIYEEYRQDFPLVGHLYRTQEQRCTGRTKLPWTGCEVLSQEVSEWEASETGNTTFDKIYRPRIRKTAEHTWLKSSSAFQ